MSDRSEPVGEPFGPSPDTADLSWESYEEPCVDEFPIMSGFYRNGSFTMYVSQGVGTWGPPFRIGSRSEITCITLEGQ